MVQPQETKDWGSMSLKDQLSISDKTYLLLKETILQGRLKPGEKLFEKDLAEKIGVSRTPVREALKQLAMESLVSVEPRKYYVVKGLTLDEVMEIVTIRSLLEPYAVKKAAAVLTDSELDELQRCVELGYQYAEQAEVEKLCNINSRFHDIFLEKNESRINKMICTMRDYIYFLRKNSLSRPERAIETAREHDQIVAAIKAKDFENVEVLMKQHIEHGRASIIKQLQSGSV